MEKKYFFVSQIRKSLFLLTVLYAYYTTLSSGILPSAKLSLGNCSREEMWNVKFVRFVTETNIGGDTRRSWSQCFPTPEVSDVTVTETNIETNVVCDTKRGWSPCSKSVWVTVMSPEPRASLDNHTLRQRRQWGGNNCHHEATQPRNNKYYFVILTLN